MRVPWQIAIALVGLLPFASRAAPEELAAPVPVAEGAASQGIESSAQAPREVVINGTRASPEVLGVLDGLAGSPIPDGRYWMQPVRWLWGVEGETTPRGVIGYPDASALGWGGGWDQGYGAWSDSYGAGYGTNWQYDSYRGSSSRQYERSGFEGPAAAPEDRADTADMMLPGLPGDPTTDPPPP